MRKCNKDGDRNLGQFMLLNLFWAGLPTELHRVINLQNMGKLKLNTAVKLATIEARTKEEILTVTRCMQWPKMIEFKPMSRLKLRIFTKYNNENTTIEENQQASLYRTQVNFQTRIPTRVQATILNATKNLSFLANTMSQPGGMQKEDQAQQAML